jgi:hypothetical protein
MRFWLSIFITLVVICSASAQELDKEAAAAFDKLINHCSDSASVIAGERKRMGNKFETELLRYLVFTPEECDVYRFRTNKEPCTPLGVRCAASNQPEETDSREPEWGLVESSADL